MALVTYSSVVNRVQPTVEGCPQPTIVNALRFAAIEFCQDSRVYEHFPAAVNSVASTANYVYALPSETEVFTVDWVMYEGSPLFFKTYDDVILADPEYPSDEGTPGFYTTVPGDTTQVWLHPVPETSVTGAIRTKLVLRPTTTSTGLEDLFFTKHLETLVHGALYRLLMIPDKSWTNPELASYHGRQFRSGVTEAFTSARKSNTSGEHRVSFRAFR